MAAMSINAYTSSIFHGCRRLCAAVAVVALACGAAVEANQTDNRGMHAVPTPGPVTIDGKLDDWDLSGRILICYDLESLRDVYSATVAMMYDSEALYVAIDWTDATPMGNRHDPRHEAAKGWAGDCVQLRLKTDRISHITAWYYAPTDEPYIGIDYGRSLTEPFKGGSRALFRTEGWKLDGGAEMAFVRHADGKGYVQEIKIPWSLITHDARYQPGESFRCGIELLWGEGDWPAHRYADNLDGHAHNREFFWSSHQAWGIVRLSPTGALQLPEPAYLREMRGEETVGPVEIAYDLPRDARVTLAIDDAQGRRVRNLIAALPREAGPQIERWDGLDDAGQPVPPGEYRVRGLHHRGVGVRYVMSFANPGRPTWDTADGRGAFYGDHTAPQAAAAAGEVVALGCPLGESGRHLIGCDLDGQRQWGLHNRSGFVIGTRASRIALATDGETLWVAECGIDSIYRVEARTGKYSPWTRTMTDSAGRSVQVLDHKVSSWSPPDDRRWTPVNLTAIAVRDGVLAATFAEEGRVRLFDAVTGDLQREFETLYPRAVAFDSDGSLIVLADDRLLRIAPDGTVAPFSAEQITNGYGLAIDAQRRVFLSVRAPDHNVKVFSPEGKLTGEIGKRGGRPHHGAFDPLAMRNPGQIAIDSRGRVWVPEETSNPKRTSVWSHEGQLQHDLVGTTGYAAAGAINPDDPTMAFADSTVYQIDIERGEWRPVYSLGGRGHEDEIFRPGAGSRARIFNRDGRTYVFGTTNRNGTVTCLLGTGDTWRVVAATGPVLEKNHPEGGPNFEHPLLREHVGKVFAWADRNGDGLVQADELTFTQLHADGRDLQLRSGWWGTLPGDDGAVTQFTSSGRHVVTIPVGSWTSDGVPVWDLSNIRVLDKPMAAGGGMIAGGSDGRVYLNTSPLAAIDADGRTLFTYPNRHVGVHGSHSASAAKPGYLIGPLSVLGAVNLGPDIGEVFCLNGNLGQHFLFTHDGLWVQSLFKDTRGAFDTPTHAATGMSMDAITAGGECFGGQFVRTRDGDVLLTIGQTDARVLRVTGLDAIVRFTATLNYTHEQYAQAHELLAQRHAAAAVPKAALIARRDATPDPDQTDDAQAMTISDGRQRIARVAATYDPEHLRVAWRVWSANDRLRNAGQDDRMLFKTGDAVDLMLGPAEPRDDGRGNLRLLISMLDRQPVAVLYEQHVPGTAADERVAFSSPWRTIHFDRVGRRDEVAVSMRPAAGGFVIEAVVPWQSLGISPGAGLTLRGDVGVLLADTAGNTTIARHYWSNPATGLVNDVPGEAELTPRFWADLTLE
jgi:sugar lactone lactonase YvrE